MASSARFRELQKLLDVSRELVVQTHDYPDIDAVASAWALAELVRSGGIKASIAYKGELRSRSLHRMVSELGIEFSLSPGAEADIVVVDGSPSNGNVSLFPGRLLGVIDHHFKSAEPVAPYLDIRPEIAACATIIRGYWAETGVEPPLHIATALLAGIQADTDFLSRRSSELDFEAYASLFHSADWERSSRIVRSALDLAELRLLVRALGAAEVRNGLLFAYLPGPCGQEALAVLADFVLRAEELRAAVIAERDGSSVHLSVRSKSPELSAFDLVKSALDGIGSGGGHSHSAGGIVPASTFPGDVQLRERFFAIAAAHPAAEQT